MLPQSEVRNESLMDRYALMGLAGSGAEARTVSEMAEKAKMSRWHFSRMFKRIVGETPQQFMLRRRVLAASEVIRSEPNMPLVEVALACGFSSQPHMTRAFVRVLGKTPGQIRKAGAALALAAAALWRGACLCCLLGA